MLKRVVITNYLGESMEYLIDGVQVDNESGLLITSIDGLGPVKATINMTELSTSDGKIFNSARVTGRNIVIKALYTHKSSIEEARLLSYKYFPIKSKVNFLIETDNRIGEVSGYVESNEPDIFSEQSGCQISILCEDAYFDGGEITEELIATINRFSFPISNPSLTEKLIKFETEIISDKAKRIIYDGDTETGVKINFKAIGDVSGIIQVAENSNAIMELDLSKMAGPVPNTSPTELPRSKCSFIINSENEWKFLSELPYLFELGFTTGFKYKNQYYVLNSPVNPSGDIIPVTPQAYYKLDGGIWSTGFKLADEIFSKPIVYCSIVYNNQIYAFYDSKYYLDYCSACKMNLDTGEWVLDENNDIPEPLYRANCIEYDGVIHLFGGQGINSNNLHHYTYSDDGLVSEGYGPKVSNEGNGKWYVGGGVAVVYHNKIHLFGGNSGDGGSVGNPIYIHFAYDSVNKWVMVEDYSSPIPSQNMSFTGGFAYVNNNDDKIHIIASGSGHYTWDEENGFVRIGSGLSNFFYGTGIYDGENLRLFGTRSSGTYTESPNNDHLISEDILVINTNNRHKSVELHRGEKIYSVINALDKNPLWFKLVNGVNAFSYSIEPETDKLNVSIKYSNKYQGV